MKERRNNLPKEKVRLFTVLFISLFYALFKFSAHSSIRFLYFSQDHLQSTIGIICGMYSSLTVVASISSTFHSFHGRLISENKVACIKREWACISSETRNFGPPLFCLFCFICSNSSLYVLTLLVIVCLFSVNLVIINFYSHCNLAAHCNSLTYAI